MAGVVWEEGGEEEEEDVVVVVVEEVEDDAVWVLEVKVVFSLWVEEGVWECGREEGRSEPVSSHLSQDASVRTKTCGGEEEEGEVESLGVVSSSESEDDHRSFGRVSLSVFLLEAVFTNSSHEDSAM